MKFAMLLSLILSSFAWAGGSGGGGGGSLFVKKITIPYDKISVEYQKAYPQWACWTDFPTYEAAVYYCPQFAFPVKVRLKNAWTCRCPSVHGE